uniref:Uncharacterized protein n=1 Tax=Strombidium inclinatum TaxID=197538 RepID=A0A7S3MWK5_9SPIT
MCSILLLELVVVFTIFVGVKDFLTDFEGFLPLFLCDVGPKVHDGLDGSHLEIRPMLLPQLLTRHTYEGGAALEEAEEVSKDFDSCFHEAAGHELLEASLDSFVIFSDLDNNSFAGPLLDLFGRVQHALDITDDRFLQEEGPGLPLDFERHPV